MNIHLNISYVTNHIDYEFYSLNPLNEVMDDIFLPIFFLGNNTKKVVLSKHRGEYL
jgi:hypothetical protein